MNERMYRAFCSAYQELGAALVKIDQSGDNRNLIGDVLRIRGDVADLRDRTALELSIREEHVQSLRSGAATIADQLNIWAAKSGEAPFVRGEWEAAEAARHLVRARADLTIAFHLVRRGREATAEAAKCGTIPINPEGEKENE